MHKNRQKSELCMARETTSHFSISSPSTCILTDITPPPKIHPPPYRIPLCEDDDGGMKETVREKGGAGGNSGNGRSAAEKERTKVRERQRRSITTNIFHGLRKHGGYRLSPRADINEVLRHLAREAGWIVEPDGTTYRSSAAASDGTSNACPLCGGGRKGTAPPTPSGSYFGGGGGGGGGDCSTTTSPHRGDSAANNLPSSGGRPSLSAGGAMCTNDALLAIYMCGAVQQNARGGGGGGVYGTGQQLYLVHQNSASNQNTPAGSP